jgi:serine/threonine protein kinase
MKTVYNKNDKAIILKDELGKGGEGTIYSVDTKTVAKIYHTKSLTPEKEGKIKALIAKKIRLEGICAPIESLFDERGHFVGYLMPKANAESGFELQTCVFNPALLKLKLSDWDRINLANLSISILEKIKLLHENDIIIGDINPFNILIKDDKTVYFVDVDSYQVDNYPCPVGTVHFTAPEIQNVDSFNKLIRTKEHEYFAVATLLFMIFHAGKTPFSFQGGGNMKENIISMNFSYPLGDEDNYLAPQGMWEFIWSELSYEIRKGFYTVFKENIRLDINDWLNILNIYLDDLRQGTYPKAIFPNSTEKIVQGRTINMNRRDIKETDSNVRIGKTIFRPNAKGENIGVLELSTKAVKFLTADQHNVKSQGFNFDFFFRQAKKTETGRGLDENNIMDMNYFDDNVLPAIKQMLRYAKEKRIDILYSVATAAYRTALNRDEIISKIREECGINVKILSKKEEALATLTAFAFSKPSSVNLSSTDKVIMIDQGGGSTELTLFQGSELIDSYSLNLGTTVLKTVLFREANKETLLSKALKDSEKFVKDRLRTYYSSKKSSLLNKSKTNFCISVGTAITNATNKKGNAKQHGTRLTLEMIKRKISETDIFLNSKYTYVADLLEDLDVSGPERNSFHDTLDNNVVMRLGLPMFVEIMEGFNLEEIIVSGTGLWYGVYFENLYELNNQ